MLFRGTVQWVVEQVMKDLPIQSYSPEGSWTTSRMPIATACNSREASCSAATLRDGER